MTRRSRPTPCWSRRGAPRTPTGSMPPQGSRPARRRPHRRRRYQRTSVDGVFALGDVCTDTPLKHVANREAEIVAHNLRHPDSMRAKGSEPVPAAVFTNPQIASVGLTQAQCRDKGIALRGRSRRVCRHRRDPAAAASLPAFGGSPAHRECTALGATSAEIVETMQVPALVGIAGVRRGAPGDPGGVRLEEGMERCVLAATAGCSGSCDATLARKSTSSDRCCDLARRAE